MKLADMTVASYLELMNSNAPAPGGGSASALCGAQGAALVAMVAGLTIGKKKYASEQELCSEVVQRATALKDVLLMQVDKDTEAFGLISAALKLPKESEEDKAVRAKAIAEATLVAAEVPLDTMKLCLKALHEAKLLVGHSNTNAASDLGVAALNLLAGVKGAWLNVLINLGGIEDGEKGKRLRREGERTLETAQSEAESIYKSVLESL